MQLIDIDHLIIEQKWSELSAELDRVDPEKDDAHILYGKSILMAYGRGEDNNLREAILELKKTII